ncbi:LapA family protein [Geodermatophilus sp. DF01-2]|uniref:LapA family protein n=1 Tax=Geodermatophilus sp. DF01-2 TaxID=2559610 RepID=UPI0010735D5B|nr:LapA family protein [Geodermatophilus sp. DF01_2]TFV54592.1 LapA family protein [Geodermatophilus sp. DF01_2]
MTAPGSDPLRTSPGTTGPSTPGAPGRPAAPPPTSTPGTTTSEKPRERHRGRTIGRTLALALLLFVTVVLVLFVVYNTQTVAISLVFANVQGPLVVALLIAAALGGLLVWLASLVLRARRRKR